MHDYFTLKIRVLLGSQMKLSTNGCQGPFKFLLKFIQVTLIFFNKLLFRT